MTALLGLMMLVQRFLPGAYKPVMDDWFLYGDIYPTLWSRLKYFAVQNEKFAIRPMAGFFDCFVNAPLRNYLWVAELLITLSLLFGVFLIMKTLRKNNISAGGLFVCLLCLMPANLEAAYWLAAATRVAYSMLFIGAAVYSLDFYLKSRKNYAMILYALLGFFAVSFYEPAIVMYILITVFVTLSNRRSKRDLLLLAVMCLHLAFIGIYYIINSGAGEIESRGGLLTENIWHHTEVVYGYIKDIFTTHTLGIIKNGFSNGTDIILGGHYVIKLTVISLLSVLLGVFSALCGRKRRFSLKALLIGFVLFLGGIALNFVLGSDRIPLRLVYFSYIGIGIIADELLTLLPPAPKYTLTAALAAAAAFVFTVSGIGEIRDYQTVSDFDAYITQQLVDMDTENNLTDIDKNTYLFGGQHSYEETRCIHYLDHIRGASAAYAELTGCMQHLTNVAFTNSIMPFTYGDTHIMKPYIDQEGVCTFYGLEYDKTVIPVALSPDGDDYNILRGDGSVFGRLVKVSDTEYQYFD